jgi:A/G-specific adenine glycosylase
MNDYYPLADRLLDWYSMHARQLPWRGQRDPYQVWVSEVMLQQTRVETVIPYFVKWMELFPDIHSLAAASQEQVLAAWEGLGYYSRARNLQRAAQILVEKHAGQLPKEARSLRRLPGIGSYTAGAIASIAFGADEVALDGNIRRVLARLFDVAVAARSPEGERILSNLAAAHLPKGKAGEFNQALMDLGAALCTPRNPLCSQCPLGEICRARALGIQEQRPVRVARREQPHHTVTAAVIQRDGQVLIARRPENGLLGGLWEFPGGKQQESEDLPACIQREIQEELGVEVQVGEELGVYRHAYTHFRITLHAYRCYLTGGEPQPVEASQLRWVTPGELQSFPMGKIDRQISRDLQLPDEALR